MRRLAVLLAALTIAACSTPPPPAPPQPAPLPPTIDNGIGSQYGNYGGQFTGETHDAAGNTCHVFNWDRPLNQDYAIRYSSLSCESKQHSWQTTTTFTRSVIPIGQSSLKDGEQ